ncbi:MAG: hypothetical protein IJF97_00845 [Eggerthellaceae bacterium]|nr:hypothetical protein [Eggerthellaceae bacterium]MBQ3342717.1 hypothetical protein [Kiritimatiellia bacterium]
MDREAYEEMALGAVEVAAFSLIANKLDKYVKQSARNTIALNASNDPRCRGYRRVASPTACEFCRQQADEGIVTKGDGGSFHAGCGCQNEPVFGSMREKFAFGDRIYTPEVMGPRWEECARTCGSDNPADIIAEAKTRTRRWVKTGKPSRISFESLKVRREVMRARPHEYESAKRLSKHGLPLRFAIDHYEVVDSKTGLLMSHGLADFANGYELKVLSDASSYNTINTHIKKTSKKENAVALIFDNSQNIHLSDDDLKKMVLRSRAFNRGRIYMLDHEGRFTCIKKAPQRSPTGVNRGADVS